MIAKIKYYKIRTVTIYEIIFYCNRNTVIRVLQMKKKIYTRIGCAVSQVLDQYTGNPYKCVSNPFNFILSVPVNIIFLPRILWVYDTNAFYYERIKIKSKIQHCRRGISFYNLTNSILFIVHICVYIWIYLFLYEEC